MYKSRFILPGLIMIGISFAIVAVIVSSDKAMADITCDHEWSEWTIDWGLECNIENQESRNCELCWEEQTRTIPKTKHKWGKWKVVRKRILDNNKGKKKRERRNCCEIQYKNLLKRKITRDEKNAIAIVTRYLRAARKYNKKRMWALFAEISKGRWYPLKKIEWIPKKYNKKIKWEFKSIFGNSKRKKVLMNVTYPDLSAKFRKAFFYAGKKAYKRWGSKSNDYKAKQIIKIFVKKCKKTVGKGKVRCSKKNVHFNMVKTKKGWRIKKNTKKLAEIITCRYIKGIDDAREKLYEWVINQYLINK